MNNNCNILVLRWQCSTHLWSDCRKLRSQSMYKIANQCLMTKYYLFSSVVGVSGCQVISFSNILSNIECFLIPMLYPCSLIKPTLPQTNSAKNHVHIYKFKTTLTNLTPIPITDIFYHRFPLKQVSEYPVCWLFKLERNLLHFVS